MRLVLAGLSLSAEPLLIRAVLVPQRCRIAEPAKYVRSIFNLVRLTNARHAEKWGSREPKALCATATT